MAFKRSALKESPTKALLNAFISVVRLTVGRTIFSSFHSRANRCA